ncbi:hypothetical protein [Paracoccus kondratievae]|uniref:Uncharacterized protein n=1 Tax=Paracoccus kondratievae TaxID=135740 RepID=A0AAD3NWT9_9RHOB|nr:hypothetical protein [Paracoccus kondratievae]GLK63352.1 hypothetical protein GCM10017635_08220 [Paracoccus kondratievae]
MNSVFVRMAIYILSPLLTMLAGLLGGWGINYDAATHVLSINVEAVIAAAVAAAGLSGAVFARWGVR